MSTVAEMVLQRTTLRVWSATRDSRVGIAIEAPTPYWNQRRFSVTLLNQPNAKPSLMFESDLNTNWLSAPRVDVRWMNPGSMWVRNVDHRDWKRPVSQVLRYEVTKRLASGHVRVRIRAVAGSAEYTYFVPTCYDFMHQFTRLWGAETKKNEIPTEPLPFLISKRIGRPRKTKENSGPKSAIDRLLEDTLLPE